MIHLPNNGLNSVLNSPQNLSMPETKYDCKHPMRKPSPKNLIHYINIHYINTLKTP